MNGEFPNFPASYSPFGHWTADDERAQTTVSPLTDYTSSHRIVVVWVMSHYV